MLPSHSAGNGGYSHRPNRCDGDCDANAGAIFFYGQDLQRGKRTEIDSLNGYVARRGAALGLPTPVNHALYTLVKLAESK